MKSTSLLFAAFALIASSTAFARPSLDNAVIDCTITKTDRQISYLPPSVGQTIRFDLSKAAQVDMTFQGNEHPGILGDLGLKKEEVQEGFVRYQGKMILDRGVSRLRVFSYDDARVVAQLDVVHTDKTGFPFLSLRTDMNCQIIK